MLVVSLFAGSPARALELRTLDASYDDGTYRVVLEAVIDAPAARVEAVLTDYANYRALDRRILSAETLAFEPGGATVLRTRVRACAGIFCRNVKRVERVERGPGRLVATVIPDRSDLRHGVTRTEWTALDSHTLVRYVSEFEPDFWVPGFVGSRLALHTLRDSTLELFTNLERRALEP